MTDSPDLQRIVLEYLRERLAWHRAQLESAPVGARAYPQSTTEGEGPSAFAHEDDADALAFALERSIEDAESRNARAVAADAEELRVRFGIPEDRMTELSAMLLRMRIEEHRTALGWTKERGNAVIRSLGDPAGVVSPSIARAPSAVDSAQTQSATVGPTLSASVDAYFAEARAAGGKREQSERQDRTTLAMFARIVGDRQVSTYGRPQVMEFRSLLLRLPHDYAKSSEWRGLWEAADFTAIARAAEARLESRALRPLTAKTIKRHMSALGAFFDHAMATGRHPGPNPAHGLPRVRDQKRESTPRVPWNADQLRKLFNSPAWVGCRHPQRRSEGGELVIRDDYWWLPVLGLYTGCRLEELCQLRRVDVQEDGGHWVLRITDSGPSQQLKNSQSRRVIPLHPFLVDLGFVRWARRGDGDVFAALRRSGPDSKKGGQFTKWFANYRKAIGLRTKGVDFHSFRKNFTDQLYATGSVDVVVDELTGHAGQGTSRTVYKSGKVLALADLASAVSRIRYPELEHLAERLE